MIDTGLSSTLSSDHYRPRPSAESFSILYSVHITTSSSTSSWNLSALNFWHSLTFVAENLPAILGFLDPICRSSPYTNKQSAFSFYFNLPINERIFEDKYGTPTSFNGPNHGYPHPPCFIGSTSRPFTVCSSIFPLISVPC